MDLTIAELVRRAQELVMRYWRAGPGTPGALGDLSEAISLLDKAYDQVRPGDPGRGGIAAQLGWLLMSRHTAHGGPVADRDRGTVLLGEALSSPGLPPTWIMLARIGLGQLRLSRALEGVTNQAARGGFLGGTSSASKADAEAAIECFREALRSPAVTPEVVATIQSLITLTEAIVPLLSGNLDFTGMISAMVGVQDLMKRGGQVANPGIASLFFTTDLTNVDPLNYPGLDLRDSDTRTPGPAPRRAVPVPVAPIEPDSARRGARGRLADLSGLPGNPIWEQALAVLQMGPEQGVAAELDAFGGAAMNAVEAGGDDDPVESGLDHLLAAVGLCLREQRDGSGWGDDSGAGISTAAAEQLLAATELIPTDHPAAAAVVETLGAVLDDTRPFGGAIPGRFTAYAAEVSPRPAVVAALSELCRATGADVAVDPGPLEAAVAAVPRDHFAYAALSTAVQQVRLAAAVRAYDPAAVRTAVGPAPEGLARLLDALVHDDAEALRGAVDGLVGDAMSPRCAAVVGASYLELTPADLDDAVRLLTAATRELGHVNLGLCTRSWWRLVATYRRRGAPGDAELSRDAGVNALRGGGQDRVSAARFAGQMLAERYEAAAYTALEVAAVASDRPVELAEDVLGVMLGIDLQASPAVEVPALADLAVAVRRVGASALLYLHPTDDVGRTAGVLCLDPATDRLDVLANLPVHDLLPLDDPGLSAITGRWSAGSLLVAASGDLGRIALSAVCTGSGRRLAENVGVTYVSSGARVIELSDRPSVPVSDAPLFVVNPRGDRDSAMVDVMVLRRLFYPRSACVGRAVESVDAAGTRDDVLSHLSGASVTHLACGLQRDDVPALLLADGDVLAVREDGLHGTGLVVLAEPAAEGFGSVADAFLDVGFSHVIGWQWAVPVRFAELALFMTHLMLVDHRMPPARAVNAVHRWMLDPDRDLAPLLTGAHLTTVDTIDLTRPALWSALACRGC